MPALKRWEPWEDAIVLKGERTAESDTKIARRLIRTPTAVRVRRQRLAPLGRPCERWTPAQDEAVTEHWERFNAFCASIGRTSHHVMERGAYLARRRAIEAREAARRLRADLDWLRD